MGGFPFCGPLLGDAHISGYRRRPVAFEAWRDGALSARVTQVPWA